MKKILCVLLAASTLSISLAACGTAADTSTDSSSDSSSDTTATDGDADYSEQDPYTVVIKLPGDVSTDDLTLISEYASEMSEELYNTTIEIQRSGWGTYFTEVTLALTSGEKLDLFYENRATYVSASTSGQIVELSQYFDEWAPTITDVISEASMDTCTINGGVYAFPANKEAAVGFSFCFNKEMADATGYDYSNITEMSELEGLLLAVQELYPDTYPIVSDMGELYYSPVVYDDLGGDFGALMDMTSTDLVVENYYASDEFYEFCELQYNWSQMGLIMPDASSNPDNASTLVIAEKGFGYYSTNKPGIDVEGTNTIGTEIATISLSDHYTTTTRVDILWMVPYSCEDPGRVVQLVNEIYTNSELQTTLVNGIEGVHYEYINEEETMIGYPDGVDATNTGYVAYPWAWFDEMITPIWEGNEETLWEETEEYNETALVSVANGFTWDNSSVSTQVTACTNALEQYFNALVLGDVDPAVYIPEFISALESAGVDAVIDEKQAQLDAWYAAK